jgi:hypothetical protein
MIRRLAVFGIAALAALGCTQVNAIEPQPLEPGDLSGYGIYYQTYEPSFYTGFAPRADVPGRLHLHVGRGNQLRATLSLSDAVIEGYANELLARYQTYRRLIDDGRVKLTQNSGFEGFEETLREVDLEGLVAADAGLSDDELAARNLELMSRLNPGRVFKLRFPVDELIRRWVANVESTDRKSMDRDRRLELINDMLPTRLWLTDPDRENSRALSKLVAAVLDSGVGPDGRAQIRPAFLALLEKISGGRYPQRGDHLEFSEFTAVYPIGTFNEYTTYKGQQIPLYPTPGRRALTYHQRTRTVDHIPTVAVYSYLPWLPYMHVGDRLHNSFHSLWWRMRPEQTDFLPPELRASPVAARNGKPYTHLWLLSRGPMSHGCTHVNAGHISELRQLLPSTPEEMEQVDVFLNKSYLYDVFDIDGDLQPEVMGVQYFVAYSLSKKKPSKLRAPMERRAYYEWLYGGDLKFDADGRGYFDNVRDGHFVERTATNGREYKRLDLYEAGYEPEKLQFYTMIDIPFARELRRAGADYSVN